MATKKKESPDYNKGRGRTRSRKTKSASPEAASSLDDKTATPAPEGESTPKNLRALELKVLLNRPSKPAVVMIDLAEKGPVHLLDSAQGGGLLIHHAQGSESICLRSMTNGKGFSLSRDAARELGAHLTEWAGPKPKTSISEWSSEGDSWALAE